MDGINLDAQEVNEVDLSAALPKPPDPIHDMNHFSDHRPRRDEDGVH